MSRKLLVAAALLVSSVALLGAQNSGPAGTEFSIATGLAGLPDAFSTQCGDGAGGDAGSEIGVAALRHLGHHLAVEADTRLLHSLHFIGGCKAWLLPVMIGYDPSLRRDPLMTSTVRLALEMSAPLATVRVTAGPGVAWGASTLPLGVASFAASTRGTRMRFFAEFERLQARVEASENHTGMGGQPPFSRPIVIHPVAHTLRVGLAWHGRG